MKVDSIVIKNYKGFRDCEVDFHPKMNVFIGSNASGKTTLLNAVLKSIVGLTSKINGSSSLKKIKNEDINYNEKFSSLIGYISDFTDSDLDVKTFIHAGIESQESKITARTIENQLNYIVQDLLKIIKVSPITIPIVKFYPANRSSVTYLEVGRDSLYQISQLETWSNIYHNSLSYSKFFHWFFENETEELRMQRDHNNFNIQNPNLRDVRKALEVTFSELGYGSFSLLSKQIKRAGNSKLLPSLFLKNNLTKEEESLDNKSDGEKAIITLIADIAYNLSIAKDFVNDDDFLKSPGIVMIDEIETHLHPKWQREILPILSKIFPNIQFFVATHSPQIVASVPSDCVFICDNFKVEKVHLKTLGEDTNSLLSEIFNATDRPKNYIELIEKFDNLIDSEASVDKLSEVIDELKKLYEKDNGIGISNFIDELNIRLSAYKFDKEYE
jgi:predicted ATP-binding protein involved in virulence